MSILDKIRLIYMKVKELKEILNKYDDNTEIKLKEWPLFISNNTEITDIMYLELKNQLLIY